MSPAMASAEAVSTNGHRQRYDQRGITSAARIDPGPRHLAVASGGRPKNGLERRIEREADDPTQDQPAGGPDAELADRPDVGDRERGETDGGGEDRGRDRDELVGQCPGAVGLQIDIRQVGRQSVSGDRPGSPWR